MINASSDDDNTTVPTSDSEDNKFTVEYNNGFDMCFKKMAMVLQRNKLAWIFPNFDKDNTPTFDLINRMVPLDFGSFWVALL